jgi:hypothetical protein
MCRKWGSFEWAARLDPFPTGVEGGRRFPNVSRWEMMRFPAFALLLLSAFTQTPAAAWAAPPDSPPAPADRAVLAAMTVADLERGLLNSKGATMLVAVKRYFPAEYPGYLEDLLARLKASDGSFGAAHLIGAEAMRAFMARHEADLVNAPPALLARINARQLDMVRGMSRDEMSLCAEYATTGFRGLRPLPEPYLSQAATLGVLFIEASRAGADRPREAGRGTLGDEDALAWYEAVRKVGTSQDVLDSMGQAVDAPPPSEDVACRTGVAVYAAIDTLPEEQAARVAAYFLHQGMTGQAAQ